MKAEEFGERTMEAYRESFRRPEVAAAIRTAAATIREAGETNADHPSVRRGASGPLWFAASVLAGVALFVLGAVVGRGLGEEQGYRQGYAEGYQDASEVER